MRILLLVDIKGVGKKGDIVSVSDGYALNYLLPTKQAVPASKNVLQRKAEEQKQARKRAEQEWARAQKVAARLSGKRIILFCRASRTGRLFAQVRKEDVLFALKKELGVIVRAEEIVEFPVMKALGVYTMVWRSGSASASWKLVIEPKT